MPSVTIGANTYEVYADLDTADAYLDGQLDAVAWRAATDDNKSRGLVSATRSIDAQSWLGDKTDSDQTLDFPRTGLTYEDGSAVPSDEVPQRVIDACCLLAAALVDGTATQNAANVASGTRRLKAGSVEVEYFRSIAPLARFPAPVLPLIGLWLDSSIGLAGSDASGVCAVPPRKAFGFTRGF